MMWYIWIFTTIVGFSGFMWGYEVGSINGVKEMPGYRKILNVSQENGTCTSSSDNVETGALLGIVVTVLHVGCFIGALLAGVLSDVAGRKVAVITGGTCCAIGSALQAGAINIWMVFPGRIISGLGIGIVYQVAPLFIAESTPKHLRGRVVSCMGILTTIGVLLGNVINTVVVKFLSSYDWGWRITLAVHGAAAILLGLGGIIVSESPRWLSKKHRYTKALAVLKRIHQDESKASSELEEIKASINKASKMDILESVKFLFHWTVLKRVLLGFCLQFIGRFAGGAFIVYYSVTLFCHIGVDGFVATVALIAIAMGFQFVSIALIDKAGRKPLLLFGALGLCLSLMTAATLIHVFNLEDLTEDSLRGAAKITAYMVVVLVILCQGIFNMSFGIIPIVVNSELYPLQIRGITVAISICGWWGGTIVVTQLSPIILSSVVGAFGIFYIMAGINIILIVYVLLLLPETKGKSLEEIEVLFKMPWHKRADILYYLSCACLMPQTCKTKCQSSNQRRLPVALVSGVNNDGEDSEQLLSLTSLEDSQDSVLAASQSNALNGNHAQDSETTV